MNMRVRKDDILIEELVAKVNELDKKLEVRQAIDEQRFDHMTAAIQANAETCKLTAENIDKLAVKTEGLVEAWNIMENVVKLGSILGKLAKWGAGLAVLGVALEWIAKRLI